MPLLPALEASCLAGLMVTGEDVLATADVIILSLMCSLMLIMLLSMLLLKLASSELVGGGREVVWMLCLLSSR